MIANLYRRLQSQPYWPAGVAVTLLLIGLRQLGGLQPLELLAYDYMIRLRPDRGPDPRLLIVEVTEQDIINQSEWPMSDQVLADLLEEIQSHSPRVVALDIYRNIPQGEGQSALSSALAKPNVVTITSIGMSADDKIPPPPGMPSDQVGFNDFPIDSDGILRRGLLYAERDREPLYSFALQSGLKYLEAEGHEFSVNGEALTIGETTFPLLNADSGGYDITDPGGYQVLLNYRSSDFVARKVSLTELFAGEVSPSWIEDKIVLIGVTAPSKKDFFYTPYSSGQDEEHLMYGVVVHAQMVSQLLSSVLDEVPVFWYLPNWTELIWILGWSIAGGILVWRMKRSVLMGAALVGGLLVLGGACLVTFSLSGWIPFAAPALGFLLTGGGLITYQVFYQSFYDPLTGLPNRALFVRQLERSLAKGKDTDVHSSLAVLVLDVDHFKAINETFGHRFGDELLICVASRIKAALPLRTNIARLGGDEFAVLLPNLAEASRATRTADLLYSIFEAPSMIDGRPITNSFSIGIALNQGELLEQAETLLQDAYRAMTRSRVLGKDHYEIFDPGMRLEAVKRFKLEDQLRQAIDNKEFILYYQPIVNLCTGWLAGFEALVRWQHPERGFVSPGDFILAAEETGLIIPLGHWILEEACRQMHEWHRRFAQARELVVSVNLSTKQFNQPDLAKEVAATLIKTKLDSSSLKLELTESAAMEDVNGTIEQLDKLKALGLKLSLDDFGTGYSSLSYLHQLQTDTLKVDRSFVGRMEEKANEDGEIVKTIIALGHQLGMDIIAEGIETAAQLACLQTLNCNYGQGYYFSKPLPKEEAANLIELSENWLQRDIAA
ncbi:MAG: EAL domain-containing protein [Cyanobacteria bacterium P01_D01_bin.1]